MSKNGFVPALRYGWATRFYDPVVRITTRERRFKQALISQAELKKHDSVLDLGCGTGTLAIEIHRQHPDVDLTALDADKNILRMARQKANELNASINFEYGRSISLPYQDHEFGYVFSTLFFHHITRKEKIVTLKEIYRVLKPGGEFHLADFGRPEGKIQAILSNIVRVTDGAEQTKENFAGMLSEMIREYGFGPVDQTGNFKTVLGTIRLFRGVESDIKTKSTKGIVFSCTHNLSHKRLRVKMNLFSRMQRNRNMLTRQV